MATDQLDQAGVIKQVYDPASESLKVLTNGGSLVPDKYDELELTYIGAGPGAGQVGTVVYKLDGSTIATLTLTYDGSDRVISVVRS
jgi:hypothetical protein